ncbi:MAG: hypothetical protein DMD87_09010 [Candidatus Rokuibacteriota bacterium]|nr:MAG: hypothetical protein DMD87_09010 [Candidatus Rokubacteria bacterium]
MDVNSYLVEWLAKEHLRELGGALARQQLAASVRPRSPLRVRLGLALIGLGQRLQGSRTRVAAPAAGASAAS